jgi:hypothetical protein
MNKKLLLLAGILVLGATTFAVHTPAPEDATLSTEKAVEVITTTDVGAIEGLVAGRQTGEGGFSGSYTGEVRARMYQGPGRSDKEGNGNYANSANKIEWTVAKGKLNMDKFGFIYDIDRDYNFNKKWEKTSAGWDTEFALDYQAGTFDMMGKEWTFVPTVGFDYDKSENYTSKHADHGTADEGRDSETKRLWKFNPKISATYYGFAMDISPIIGYDDAKETTAFQLNITNYRKLSDTWSLAGDFYFDFAGTSKTKKDKKTGKEYDDYSNGVFDGNIDEDNKFAFSIEQYLGYEREVAENTYFITEFGLEAYSILQSANNDISMYVAPELQYRAKLGQANITPYVKYISYTATGWAAGSYAKEELSVGVRFGTKF